MLLFSALWVSVFACNTTGSKVGSKPSLWSSCIHHQFQLRTTTTCSGL